MEAVHRSEKPLSLWRTEDLLQVAHEAYQMGNTDYLEKICNELISQRMEQLSSEQKDKLGIYTHHLLMRFSSKKSYYPDTQLTRRSTQQLLARQSRPRQTTTPPTITDVTDALFDDAKNAEGTSPQTAADNGTLIYIDPTLAHPGTDPAASLADSSETSSPENTGEMTVSTMADDTQLIDSLEAEPNGNPDSVPSIAEENELTAEKAGSYAAAQKLSKCASSVDMARETIGERILNASEFIQSVLWLSHYKRQLNNSQTKLFHEYYALFLEYKTWQQNSHREREKEETAARERALFWQTFHRDLEDDEDVTDEMIIELAMQKGGDLFSYSNVIPDEETMQSPEQDPAEMNVEESDEEPDIDDDILFASEYGDEDMEQSSLWEAFMQTIVDKVEEKKGKPIESDEQAFAYLNRFPRIEKMCSSLEKFKNSLEIVSDKTCKKAARILNAEIEKGFDIGAAHILLTHIILMCHIPHPLAEKLRASIPERNKPQKLEE